MRFFKLDDEKFFRIPDLDWARPGEPERGNTSPSLVVARASTGVGGDITSVGLGAAYGEEGRRDVCGTGGRLDGKGCFCCNGPALLGGTVELPFGTRGGGINGGKVSGAGWPAGFDAVSIFSCFRFCPDSLRLRTPWVADGCCKPGSGGGGNVCNGGG